MSRAEQDNTQQPWMPERHELHTDSWDHYGVTPPPFGEPIGFESQLGSNDYGVAIDMVNIANRNNRPVVSDIPGDETLPMVAMPFDSPEMVVARLQALVSYRRQNREDSNPTLTQ